jgi:DNA-binding transcriptional LysR family regulator
LKLEFLATLDAIVKNGTFAAAAEEVGLTASAVSLQMKRLEEYIGQPLFDRSGRTAKPTPVARELCDSVRSALSAVEAARARHSGAVTGRVVLGTIRSLQSTMIPVVLRDIAARHPDLSVRVIQGDSTELLNQLKAGELDGAALIRPSSGGSSRLDWHDLQRQPFVFVAPADSGDASPVELVRRYGWLQFDTSLTSGRVAASYLHRLSPGTRPKFELESIEAVLAMVAMGLGVSVIPKLGGAMAAARPVRQIPLGKNGPSRQISFVCRSSDAESRRLTALREAFVHGYADAAA